MSKGELSTPTTAGAGGSQRQLTSSQENVHHNHDAVTESTQEREQKRQPENKQEIVKTDDASASFSVKHVIISAFLGIGVGIALSLWNYDDTNGGDAKNLTLQWIGLIGDLFIRALKCVVLPLVFVNVSISVMDMLQIGKAKSIGWKVIGFYFFTTVTASFIGIASVLSFKGLFNRGESEDDTVAIVYLGCNQEGSYLAETGDGTLMCTADYGSEENISFEIVDVNGSFETASSTNSEVDGVSMSDAIYDGVFIKLVAANITDAFATDSFAAVIVFAVVFGVALSRALDNKQKQSSSPAVSHVLEFFKELDAVFMNIINGIITLTPLAIFSLIAEGVGSQTDLSGSFANVGYLVAATIVALIGHYLVIDWGLFAIITGRNPASYMKHLIPAQAMAFACSSSASTIPMTFKSVRSTGCVPDSIARFVIPLGATINMDGSALYYPCTCIWLAVLNGIEPNLSHYVLLAVMATIGSAGAAPIPSVGGVLIIIIYNTVFGASGVPEGFSYILAVDWFLDRLITMLNVTGDAVIAGMVSSLVAAEEEDENEDEQEPNDV